jgi:phosphoribosylformimino-5-aminoimidazole carboxamide ribotide isomerase
MKVIPAIDILDGKCVRLVGGDMRRKTIEIEDPVGVAKGFQRRGASYLHVIDLGRALDQGDNRSIVARIIKGIDIPIQVGGGLRTDEEVLGILELGADRVIVGTRAVRDPAWLNDMAKDNPGRIVVAVDSRGEEILIKGWQEGSGRNLFEFAKEVDKKGLAAFLFTNVDVEGQCKGTELDIVERFVKTVKAPVIAAGGITTIKDLELLEEAGVAAAVVGSAIYEKKLDLKEALDRFEGPRYTKGGRKA